MKNKELIKDMTPLQAQKIMLNRKRLETEPDLITLITEDIKNEISEEAAKLFYNLPKIQLVKDLNPIRQRIEINRVLSSLLLMYRAVKKKDITDVISFISFDLNPALWRTSLMENVYPFLKENKVFETIYGGTK